MAGASTEFPPRGVASDRADRPVLVGKRDEMSGFLRFLLLPLLGGGRGLFGLRFLLLAEDGLVALGKVLRLGQTDANDTHGPSPHNLRSGKRSVSLLWESV